MSNLILRAKCAMSDLSNDFNRIMPKMKGAINKLQTGAMIAMTGVAINSIALASDGGGAGGGTTTGTGNALKDVIGSLLNILGIVCLIAGAFVLVFGLIKLVMAIRDQEGSDQMKAGMFIGVGAGLVALKFLIGNADKGFGKTIVNLITSNDN